MSEEKTTEGPEQRLIAEVVDGRIVISIGVETLKYCHNQLEHGFEPRKGYGSGFLITNAEGFARDVVSRLKSEREDGSTILTDLLDKATEEAADDGSEHTEERFGWFCEQCEKGMAESEDGYSHADGIVYCSQECAEERDANR